MCVFYAYPDCIPNVSRMQHVSRLDTRDVMYPACILIVSQMYPDVSYAFCPFLQVFLPYPSCRVAGGR